MAKIHLETLKKLARTLKLDNNNGYAVSVLIALIVVSVFVASYYVLLKPSQKRYMTIYLLDSQKTALNYPEFLAINQNNTLNMWIKVENHMGKSQQIEVLQKTTVDMIHLFPLEAEANARYERTLENGETWEIPATITLDTPGNYSVIFELWAYDKEVGELQFSGNACVLNIEAEAVLSNQTNDVEITAFSAQAYWNPVGGVLVGYPFNVTIQNIGVNDVSGVTLMVIMLIGDSDLGRYSKHLDTLISGEMRVMRGEITKVLSQGVNPDWTICVATLMLGDTVLDERKLP